MNFGKKLLIGSVVAIAVLVALLILQSSKDIDLNLQMGGAPANTNNITLFCAAGIKAPIVEAAKDFEQKYSVHVNLEYGGSGTLLNKLNIARIGDLYLAGDSSYTKKAKDMDLVAEQLPLAYMRAVIAVQKGNPKNIKSLADLSRFDVRVGLGNPEASAIGKVSKKVLIKEGLWDKIQSNINRKGVFKPTVSELVNDVQLGAVDAVIVWDINAFVSDKIEIVSIDGFSQEIKTVTVGVLNSSKNPTMALRFARYLNSKKGNVIFKKYGFDAVDGDKWAWKPEITFFCGSVNRGAISSVLKRFQQREGVVINTKYNGCGILTADMKLIKKGQGGGNFPDVYMACDRYYLNTVKDWFQEDVDISDTDIVIVVPKGNPANIKSIKDLAKTGLKISVGQCDQCTIGALTKIMLQREDLYNDVMKNVKVQTASSSMLVPTVMKTKNMNTVLDATLAYRVDTLGLSNQVDVIEIHSINAKAIQPFSLSVSSKYKYLDRRLKLAVMSAKKAFIDKGFNFRAQQ